jgi:hypothetical protein
MSFQSGDKKVNIVTRSRVAADECRVASSSTLPHSSFTSVIFDFLSTTPVHQDGPKMSKIQLGSVNPSGVLSIIEEKLAFVTTAPIPWQNLVLGFSWTITVFETYLL